MRRLRLAVLCCVGLAATLSIADDSTDSPQLSRLKDAGALDAALDLAGFEVLDAAAIQRSGATAVIDPGLGLDFDYQGDAAAAAEIARWAASDPTTLSVTPDGRVEPSASLYLVTAYAPTEPGRVVGAGTAWLGKTCYEDTPIPTETQAALNRARVVAAAGVDRAFEATGCLADSAAAADLFLGTGWVLDATRGEIVTVAHVLTEGHVATWGPSGLRLDSTDHARRLVFELPCATEAGDSHNAVHRYPVRAIRHAMAGHEIVVLGVDVGAHPLPPAPIVRAPARLVALLGSALPWVEIIGLPSRHMVYDPEKGYNAAERAEADCALGGLDGYDRRRFSVGPLQAAAATSTDGALQSAVVRHAADTVAGVSGGPVLDVATGEVVGVHACSTRGRGQCVGAERLPPDGGTRPNIAWNTEDICAYRAELCR